ncbi:MAG: cation:proton antiporter [Campylobacterota bacterium]|nr:cation:proton antiporter [Campylobacterota bacterium]
MIVFIGGLLVGVMMAFIFGWLIGRVESDPFIEVPLTMVLAYASFVMAEEIHLSGVMAVVAAGVMMGGWGRTKISPAISHYLSELWEYFAFIANALIFLLVGLLVDLGALWESLDLLMWVVLAMLFSRFVVVYMIVPLANRFGSAERVEREYQHIMYWGGLRGAVALALVLSLPESEFKPLLLALTIGAVLFTLIVQGLSIRALVHKLGLDNPPLGDRIALPGAALDAVQKARDAIPSFEKFSLANSEINAELSREYKAKVAYWKKERAKLVRTELSPKDEKALLFVEGFMIEKRSYYEMFTQGDLSERDYHDLAHSIDVQVDHLHSYGTLPSNTLHGILLRRLERGFLHLLERHFSTSSLLQRYSRYYTARDYIKSWAQYFGSGEVLAKLPERAKREGISLKSLEEVIATYSKWHNSAGKRLEQTASQFPEFVDMMQERRARRLSLFVERQTIERHIKNGEITEKMGGDLLESIDNDLRQLRGYDTKGLSIDTNELLSKVAFFKNMKPEELTKIKEYLHLITVPPNEYIIGQGDKGTSMFFIARGEIKVLREEEGNSKLLGVLKAGDFFGEQSLLNHEVRNATCRAATACALYELNSKEFTKIIEIFPEVKKAVDEVNRVRG